MAVVKKKDGRWFCVFYDDNGKQVWKSFGRGVEAKKAAQAFDLEIKAKKKRNIAITSTPKIDITHLTQEYLNFKRDKLHKHTIQGIVFLINQIVAPIIGGKNITSLTKKDFLPIVQKLQDRGLSQSSINRYITYLQAILNWGVDNDYITHNPFAKYKKEAECEYEPYIPSEEELEKLLSVAPEHLSWALLVEFYTGCRPGQSELFALKWEHIDWKRQILKVPNSKKGKKKIRQPYRIVFLQEDFFELLKEKYQNRDCEYIISYQGKPVTTLKRSWATAKKKAGITKRLRLYDLRHAFVTYMLAHKADIKAVSLLAGHHSTKMTMDRYYQAVEELQKQAVSKLPKLTVVSKLSNKSNKQETLQSKVDVVKSNRDENIRQTH